MRKLPIGIQSFEKLRKDGYLYVDKTEYIWNLVNSGTVYFLSRPRRFGKSLLISTMQAYFEGKKELFDGLAIATHEAEKPAEEQWGTYPLILFSLSSGEYSTEDGLRDQMKNSMQRSMEKYGVSEEAVFGETLPVRFSNLIRRLKEKTGRPVVVLVDEYDKPLLANMSVNPEQLERSRTIYKEFFSTLKDMDAYLKFVFFTGVTKFSKVSIFSDLNQLRDISLLDEFSGICGITEEELKKNFQDNIQTLAAAQNLTYEETLDQLARTYDGYHFSSQSEGVYNPFSLLNAFAAKEFGRYWFETGTPTFLIQTLRSNGLDVQDFSAGVTATAEQMMDYRAEDPDVIPLFYQAGYLTIAGYEPLFREYTLRFPNEEVKYGFLSFLLPRVNAAYVNTSGPFSAGKMIRALQKGDAESVMTMLQALLASIPYYEGQAPQNEQQWRNLLYAVFSILGQYVRAEIHTSRGRSDCILENEAFVYIFEFKQDQSADDALQQIEEKGYAAPYASSGKSIVKIGANFSMEKKTIDEWKIEE